MPKNASSKSLQKPQTATVSTRKEQVPLSRRTQHCVAIAEALDELLGAGDPNHYVRYGPSPRAVVRRKS